MNTIQAPRTLDLCRQAVISSGVALPALMREEVAKAGRRLGVDILTDDELADVLRDASRHDPRTGRSVDGDGALAAREELVARRMFRAS